ncbi:MAG: hypothetical protein LBD20_04540 [Spirochaetaceae bacterium]|nr:hypothetical protein [Spirochaetaceae bacterium]
MQGGTQQFSAELQRNGANVTDSPDPVWSITTTPVDSGTTINPSSGSLIVSTAETATTLTVRATITYSGSTYTGDATVTVTSMEDTADALGAISSAADAGALFNALKSANSVLDTSLILEANKDAYFASKTAMSAILSSISESPTPAEITNVIHALEELIKTINFTVATSDVLAAFNNAGTVDAIQNLLTAANFDKLYPNDAGKWKLYHALDGKATIAQAILTGKTNSGGSFTYTPSLVTAISTAIFTQQTEEADNLVPAFSAGFSFEEIVEEITPLLTEKNFIILGANNWETYNGLHEANKELVAVGLNARSYSINSSALLTSAINSVVNFSANSGQNINTAIAANVTIEQVNAFIIGFAVELYGMPSNDPMVAGMQLTSSELNTYKALITEARAGSSSPIKFTAIKTYLDASAQPSALILDQIWTALEEITNIIQDVKSGVSYTGKLTITGLTTGVYSYGVYVHDLDALPTQGQRLDNATRVARASLYAPGNSAEVILAWYGSFSGSKVSRNFVVVIRTKNSFNGVHGGSTEALVAFDAQGNATVTIQ